MCVDRSGSAAGRPLRARDIWWDTVRNPDMTSIRVPVSLSNSSKVFAILSARSEESCQVQRNCTALALDTWERTHDAYLRAYHLDYKPCDGGGSADDAAK